MRNIIWLVAGTCIGLGYGIYLLNKSGTSYSSEMTVKANFNSAGLPLQYHGLSERAGVNGQTNELASIFSITPAEARRLNDFRQLCGIGNDHFRNVRGTVPQSESRQQYQARHFLGKNIEL